MEYRYIGRSGLRVSPICMGTMTFGSFCDRKTSFSILDRAYECGINFFDTAELYPVPPRASWAGETEKIVGEWLATKPRDSIVLATKVAGAASGWFVPPIRHGMTAIDRFHIERAVEGSLKRLKTDYIDLYQMHWPDTVVPIEESLEAFDRLVESGKVRYIGTSNDTAYGLTKANETSRYLGYARFESIQNNFSLLNRRFLDELAAVCRTEKISLLPYAPLAGGVLSGKYNGEFYPPDARYTKYLGDSNPRIRAHGKKYLNEKTLKATALYLQIAQAAGLSVTTMAIAWSLRHDFVASSIIGATSVEQLDETLAALDVTLDEQILEACDRVHETIPYPMG